MNKNEKSVLLDNLYLNTRECMACKLGSHRHCFVFGEGSPDARIMFIGEGPGKQEDQQGRPFVGRAGELLTAIIEKGLKIKREEVYIANVVKCRPTVNLEGFKDRPPDPEEVAACSWMLEEQIKIIEPLIIITLGNPSTKFLLKTEQGITKLRGKMSEYNGIPVMPTYHPSYLLRNDFAGSQVKREAWEDMKQVIAYLASHSQNGEETAP